MPRLFVIMPFGLREVPHLPVGELDFDAIYGSIIKPAGLAAVGVLASMTRRAGNAPISISAKSSRRDIVLADISITNANVFYELGIRQAISPGGQYFSPTRGHPSRSISRPSESSSMTSMELRKLRVPGPRSRNTWPTAFASRARTSSQVSRTDRRLGEPTC